MRYLLIKIDTIPKNPSLSRPVVFTAEISPIASPTYTPISSPVLETKTTDANQGNVRIAWRIYQDDGSSFSYGRVGRSSAFNSSL